jgi:hypothetical protein
VKKSWNPGDRADIREFFQLYGITERQDADGTSKPQFYRIGEFNTVEEAITFAKKVKALKQPTIELDI